MADPFGTEPMFDIPDRYRPKRSQKVGVTWRRHTGKTTSCDDCTIDLAEGRVQFMPTPASLVRSDSEGRRYYCHEHAHRRKELDRERGAWTDSS